MVILKGFSNLNNSMTEVLFLSKELSLHIKIHSHIHTVNVIISDFSTYLQHFLLLEAKQLAGKLLLPFAPSCIRQ